MPQCAQNGGTSAHYGSGRDIDTSQVDIAQIHRTLEKAFAEEAASGMSRRQSEGPTDGESTATQSELAIGSAGETYVSLPFHQREVPADSFADL